MNGRVKHSRIESLISFLEGSVGSKFPFLQKCSCYAGARTHTIFFLFALSVERPCWKKNRSLKSQLKKFKIFYTNFPETKFYCATKGAGEFTEIAKLVVRGFLPNIFFWAKGEPVFRF
jgi:hypothetical protein